MNTKLTRGAFRRSMAAIAAIALVASACGGDDDDTAAHRPDRRSPRRPAAIPPTHPPPTHPPPTATRSRPRSCTSARSATPAGPRSTTTVGSSSKQHSASASRPATSRACRKVPSPRRTFERLARDGADVIFGTSFGYMDQMLAVAGASTPTSSSSTPPGYKTADNMSTYFGAAEEARYLSGMAAASMTKSGQIGYVAAFPIPEVLRGINAFTLGAQRINPDVTVEGRLDVDLVRSGDREGSRRGTAQRRRRRDRPAPGHTVGRRGRPDRRWLLGRLQRRHVALRPGRMADRPRVGLGPVLHQRRRGRP